MISATAEDYLRNIYELGESRGTVSLSDLSKEMSISSVSVNEMVKKLTKRGMTTYKPYEGVTLTPNGRTEALSVTRRHRLWERFLTDILGISWDLVHKEAHLLEHATSRLVEERLAKFLGSPETCPHGYPMPTVNGEVTQVGSIPLSELKPGDKAVILTVPEEPEILKYLDELGLLPETTIEIISVDPFEGPLTLRIGGNQHIIGRKVASMVRIRSI